MVKVLILTLALCTCAGFKGFHLKRGDASDNIRGDNPFSLGSGDGT